MYTYVSYRYICSIVLFIFISWLPCLYVVNSVMCHPDPLLATNYLSES